MYKISIIALLLILTSCSSKQKKKKEGVYNSLFSHITKIRNCWAKELYTRRVLKTDSIVAGFAIEKSGKATKLKGEIAGAHISPRTRKRIKNCVLGTISYIQFAPRSKRDDVAIRLNFE